MRSGEKDGFTLIELLLAVSLTALLGAMLAVVLTNSRRIAAATTDVTNRFRNEWVLQETIQSELDVSTSALTLESANERVSGFAFTAFGPVRGRTLRVRIRYVFELDPERPVFRLARYLVAEGIGMDETKEILIENIDSPKIEAYSDAAGDFVAVEQLTGPPIWVRLTFNILKTAPRTAEEIRGISADSIRILVKNSHGLSQAL